MGRTDQSQGSKSPVKHYIKFAGDTGVYSYWDKEREEKVAVETFDGIVLDTRASVTGWNDDTQEMVFSNLVQDVTREEFSVKTKTKTLRVGLWKDIKDSLKDISSFTQNIFMLTNIGGTKEWELGRLELRKSGLNAWVNFTKDNSLYSDLLKFTKGDMQKKGRVEYFMPEITLDKLADKNAKLADEFEKNILKPFLNQGDSDKIGVEQTSIEEQDEEVPF